MLDCLAKHPADRPASARELADRLARCNAEEAWTRADAMQWWEPRLAPEPAVTFSD